MPEDKFVALMRRDAEPALGSNAAPSKSIQKLLQNDSVGGRIETWLHRPDVSYSLATEVPNGRLPRVGIFHDAVPITHPELLARPTDAYSHQGSEAQRLFDSLRSVDLLHCGSMFAQNQAAELIGVPQERSFIAYHGLDLPPRPTAAVKEPRYLLTISRLDPRKNLIRLIQAFDAAKLKDVRLVIVGQDGWGVESIRDAAMTATCRDQIEFLGHVLDDDLPRLYSEASWYICPSIMEGFGLPVMEAMHYGCPVICTTAGAVPEVGGAAALYFDPVDVEAMSHQIRTAFESDRSKFSDLALQRSIQFSPDNMCMTIAANLERFRK